MPPIIICYDDRIIIVTWHVHVNYYVSRWHRVISPICINQPNQRLRVMMMMMMSPVTTVTTNNIISIVDIRDHLDLFVSFVATHRTHSLLTHSLPALHPYVLQSLLVSSSPIIALVSAQSIYVQWAWNYGHTHTLMTACVSLVIVFRILFVSYICGTVGMLQYVCCCCCCYGIACTPIYGSSAHYCRPTLCVCVAWGHI